MNNICNTTVTPHTNGTCRKSRLWNRKSIKSEDIPIFAEKSMKYQTPITEDEKPFVKDEPSSISNEINYMFSRIQDLIVERISKSDSYRHTLGFLRYEEEQFHLYALNDDNTYLKVIFVTADIPKPNVYLRIYGLCRFDEPDQENNCNIFNLELQVNIWKYLESIQNAQKLENILYTCKNNLIHWNH